MADKTREVYLGDGLYCSFDGFMFILRAPRHEGDHWVALEPQVLAAFDEFRKVMVAEYLGKPSREENE